ncbi:hypothetical protein AAD018_010525 [Aestuariibius insulae]|uniref:hypothetical protein n=1 Tax=Aestuariibius insulae TaxID=2058287 RepID=UPI00345E13AA
MQQAEPGCCHRLPTSKETTLSLADYGSVDVKILEIARLYWQTFAMPQSQSWLTASIRADRGFRGRQGGEVAMKTLAAVQAMRMSRVSCFRFNAPDCPGCSQIVSEHERQFMSVLQAVREDRPGAARTHAMLLCEGNETEPLISSMAMLARAASPVSAGTGKSPASVRRRKRRMLFPAGSSGRAA